MDNLEFLFSMNQGENKANRIVASALQDKLALDEPISKDDVVSTIQGIDVGAIVQATIKKLGINEEILTSDKESIVEYEYSNKISLSRLYLPNAVNIKTGAIQGCVQLINLNAPNCTNIINGAMKGCISLSEIDFPSLTNIDSTVFMNCISLKSIKLSTNQVVNLAHINAFTSTPIIKRKGYIYVPDELVDSYKTATNWSVYADQIRPLSEYIEE